MIVGWYASNTSPDANSDKGRWRYYTATSYDFGKTFNRATITRKVFHYGNICNQGVTCPPGSNRNLLDFSSLAVNPRTGCALAAIPGDPFDNPTNRRSDPAAAYTAHQTAGRCLTNPAHHRHHRHRRPPPRFTG